MSNSKEMFVNHVGGIEFMGDNIRARLKYCGTGVRLYPLCKMIHAEQAMLDNCCQLFDYVFVDAGKSLKIGKYSTLTWYSLIEGGANTFIGDRVFVGPGCRILTSTYRLNGFYSIEHIPDECHSTEYGDIVIHDDAYLGANCTIMPGTILGEGSVIGANSFVEGELEPWTIYAGTPCKPIGIRKQPSEEMRQRLLELDWSPTWGT